jgi:hypothetical protein
MECLSLCRSKGEGGLLANHMGLKWVAIGNTLGNLMGTHWELERNMLGTKEKWKDGITYRHLSLFSTYSLVLGYM